MPTVEAARKMWSRASSSATANENFRRLKAAFVEGYQVVHSADASPFDVYAAPGLPYVGQPFPGTSYVLAQKGQVQQVSPILSIVIINYEGEVGPQSGGSNPNNSPIFAPPKLTTTNVAVEEEIDQDLYGNPIATVIGEPIRGVKRRFVDKVLTIERNFVAWNDYLQAVYSESVNSDTFYGWPPGTARIMDLSAENVIDPTIGYWRGTMKVQFRYPIRTTAEKVWWARVRHEGFYEIVESSDPPDANGNYKYEIVRAVDKNKQPVNKPVMLDQFGKRITNSNLAFWREFQLYTPLPYNSLGFL